MTLFCDSSACEEDKTFVQAANFEPLLKAVFDKIRKIATVSVTTFQKVYKPCLNVDIGLIRNPIPLPPIFFFIFF